MPRSHFPLIRWGKCINVKALPSKRNYWISNMKKSFMDGEARLKVIFTAADRALEWMRKISCNVYCVTSLKLMKQGIYCEIKKPYRFQSKLVLMGKQPFRMVVKFQHIVHLVSKTNYQTFLFNDWRINSFIFFYSFPELCGQLNKSSRKATPDQLYCLRYVLNLNLNLCFHVLSIHIEIFFRRKVGRAATATNAVCKLRTCMPFFLKTVLSKIFRWFW